MRKHQGRLISSGAGRPLSAKRAAEISETFAYMESDEAYERHQMINALMREGNDRPTACIIADARIAAAKQS